MCFDFIFRAFLDFTFLLQSFSNVRLYGGWKFTSLTSADCLRSRFVSRIWKTRARTFQSTWPLRLISRENMLKTAQVI